MKTYYYKLDNAFQGPVTADELNYLFSKGIIERSTPIRDVATDETEAYSVLVLKNYRASSKKKDSTETKPRSQPGILNFLQIIYTLLYIASIVVVGLLFVDDSVRMLGAVSLPVLPLILSIAVVVHIKYTELRYLFEIRNSLEREDD